MVNREAALRITPTSSRLKFVTLKRKFEGFWKEISDWEGTSGIHCERYGNVVLGKLAPLIGIRRGSRHFNILVRRRAPEIAN